MNEFSYQATLKTKSENEFFNFQHCLLISSKQITGILYQTSVTPHQVIFISLLFGLTSSFLFIQNSKTLAIIGAVLLLYKNILDKVDGSLARAKNLVSRRGRFYDSISDFIVSLSLFSAISYILYSKYHNPSIFLICFLGLISSMLQCSYFVFYELSYIKMTGKNSVNRILENVTPADYLNEDKFTLFLQKIFIIIYGWQDYFFYKLDILLKNMLVKSKSDNKSITLVYRKWYYNKKFLSMASFISIGTHLFLISIFAVLDKFGYYLFLNLIVGNLFIAITVFYHYYSTKTKIQ